MSWEPFESWPGEGGQGAFRGASEPVLAQCRGLSLAQRLRFFWSSSPDLPAKRVAERVAVTGAHVYVERRDGTRERVTREALQGIRRDGPVTVVGVLEGEDIFVPSHERCPVEETLRVQLGRQGRITFRENIPGAAVLALAAGALGTHLLSQHSLWRAVAHLHHELYTSETVIGVSCGLAAVALALVVMLWVPAWVTVDATGVEVRRGLVPWLPFRVPAEEIKHASYTPQRDKNGHLLGYRVTAVLREAKRFASLSPRTHVTVGYVRADYAQASESAQKQAEEAHRILGL
jgi:hypothetical protein